jgi:NhaP-type Na+/H+ or K+/H+ antiporter
MLSAETILVLLTCVASYALLSGRIERSVVTLPMIFTGLGLVFGELGLALVPMGSEHELIHTLAEITLVLVLFSDASGVKIGLLRHNLAIPGRMLLIGMPLTIALGAVLGKVVSPEASWPIAILTAAILTPTDAALGQAVVSSRVVPERLSQGINVESGLNDGLALPFVLVAAIMAVPLASARPEAVPDHVGWFTFLQITLGPLVGVALGWAAARLLDRAVSHQLATPVSQGLYFLTVAFLAYFTAEVVGGNGFIAAFVGGLTFGNALRAPSEFIHEFMEGEGELLTMATFFFFGAVLAPEGLEHANPRTLGIALAFLTVVRMVPVMLSLTGLGLSWYEKVFLGWFGPRGLASILFALLVLERFPIPGAEELTACVVLTVLLSILLHGLTAVPLSNRFAQR